MRLLRDRLTIVYMGKITEQLNRIVSTPDNTDKLYKIFKSIDDYDLPVIRFYMGEGTTLLRQRINGKGKEFNLVSELYYPPAICLKTYGRANLPFQSMFYACSFPLDNAAPYPRLVTLMETSDFFKNTESCGIERATCSKWRLKSQIELIVLPFYKHYDRACNDILQIQTQWDEAVKKTRINREAKELVDYMSAEISKQFDNSNDYFKIANFINYLLYVNEKTKTADGVMYPSVPAAGGGFNVVLKKESADEKVEFVNASMCYLAKNKMKSYEMITNDSTNVSDEGVITYTPRIIEEAEKNMYDSYAQGLDFIN